MLTDAAWEAEAAKLVALKTEADELQALAWTHSCSDGILPCLSGLIFRGDHVHCVGPVISTVLGIVTATWLGTLVGSRSIATSITVIDGIVTMHQTRNLATGCAHQ